MLISKRDPVFTTLGAAAVAALLSVALLTASVVVSFRQDGKWGDELSSGWGDESSVESSSESSAEGCEFGVDSGVLPSPEPLLLRTDGPLDVNAYLMPDNNGILQLAAGEKVLVACPGTKVGALAEEVVAVCASGTTFTVNGATYDISQLGCSAQPTHTAAYTGATCGSGGRGLLAKIGHETSRGRVVLEEACFVDETMETLYASSTVSRSIGGARTGVKRPSSFVATADFYDSVKPESHYKRIGQQEAFATLLGSQALAFEYIANSTSTSNDYLTHGHLVAKADFIWAQQQRATFYYINVAPQWQTFNGGNWERLESSVRELAAAREADLLVITGTWGRAQLSDVTGKATDLYINADGLIPVPALYWKVVYDNATREGVAFVGVNNPYTTLKGEPRLVLCKDVCASVSWVLWAPDSVKAGEGYCCEVDALRAALPDVPELKVDSLLGSA